MANTCFCILSSLSTNGKTGHDSAGMRKGAPLGSHSQLNCACCQKECSLSLPCFKKLVEWNCGAFKYRPFMFSP